MTEERKKTNTKQKGEERAVSNKSIVLEYVEAIVIAIILALFIRKFIIQAYKIPSGSMLETLQIGDHILVNKFIFYFNDPERGDIIVFKYPVDKKRDFIKRVIGMPGDSLEIKDKNIFINGELLNEPYTIFKDKTNAFRRGHPSYLNDPYIRNRDNFGPLIIPEGKYFMMGDNRDFSQDSRYWGLLDRELIEGKALVIYWSWDKQKIDFFDKIRWNRIGKLLN